MIKKILCLAFCAALLLVPLFWQSISRALLKAGIDRYCIHHFGCSLQTESMHREGKYWVFERPGLSQAGANLSAERLLLRIEVHPVQRLIDLEVLVDRSRIEFNEEGSNLEEVISDIVSKSIPYWMFNIQTAFQIKEGKLIWREKGEQGLKNHEADFSLHAKSDQNLKECSLFLDLDGKESDANHFELVAFKEKNDPLNADLIFKNVELGKIARIYQALGHPFYGWEVLSGKIDGKLHLHQPAGRRAYLWGGAKASDLAFFNSKLEMKASVGSAAADLETKVKGKALPRITGNLSLEGGASLEISKDGLPYWNLSDVKGNVAFLPGEGITLSFQGECSHKGDRFGIQLNGEASIFDDSQAAVDLVCSVSAGQKKDCEVKLSMRQLGFMYNAAEIEVKNVGKEEFSLFQRALHPYFPETQGFEMQSGSIDLAGIAFMEGYRLTDVKIEKILGRGLKLDFDPIDLSLHVEETTGALSMNFAEPDPLASIDADFELNGGAIDFLGINGNRWEFRDLLTTLGVRGGILKKSEIKGVSAGFTGSIDVDWMQKENFLSLNFTGPAKNIATFLPLAFTKGIENAFADDTVNIVGTMSWKDPVSTFDGQLRFTNPSLRRSDLVAFGFDLEECSDKLWNKQPEDKLAASYWETAGLEAMQKVIPPIASPMLLLETNWILAESGIAGLVVRKGWFHAENISLEHYVSPFFFDCGQMELKGLGNLEGVFDHKCVAIDYEAFSVEMENPYLKFDVPRIGQARTGNGSKIKGAAHFFDFQKGRHFGTIPFANAKYLEKNSGLVLNDVEAVAILAGQEVHFLEMKAKCEGLEASGELDLDFNLPGGNKLSLGLRISSLEGPVTSAKAVLQRIQPTLSLLNFPADGQISLQGPPANLSIVFGPEMSHFDANFQGKITDLSAAFEGTRVSISGMKLNFSYEHQKRSLNITNIYGDLHLGGPKKEEKYVVSGEYIRFPDFLSGISEFDVWVGDQSRDIFRLVGKTLPEERQGQAPLVAFHINHELTHFGDVHPANFRLILKEGAAIDTFSLSADVRLGTVLHDLQRLVKTGIFSRAIPFSDSILNLRKAQGNFHVKMEYADHPGEMGFRVKGDRLELEDYRFDNFLLAGRKKGDFLCVDKFALDDFELQGFLKEKDEAVNFTQLKMSLGSALALEMDGDFSAKREDVQARIIGVEVDFAKLKERIPLAVGVLNGAGVRGKMKGSGGLTLKFTKTEPGIRADAILDATFASWGMLGLRFQDVHNVSCHFISDKGVSLRNLEFDLLPNEPGPAKGHLSIEKAAYEFQTGGVEIDRLAFKIPSQNLDWFAKAIGGAFPQLISPAVSDVIRDCRREEDLAGEIQYEYTPPYTAFQLKAADGKYVFWNNELDVSDFLLEYDPFELKVSAASKIGGSEVLFEARSTSPTLSDGDLVVLKPSADGAGSDAAAESLTVAWANDPHFGLSVKQAAGHFSGLKIHLKEDPLQPLSSKEIHLIGRIDIDAVLAGPLLPEDISKRIEDWKVRDGFQLQGRWKVKKEASGKDYSSNLNFQGRLEGRECGILGYRFDRLESNLEYTPSAIRIRNFKVADLAANLEAEQIELVKANNGNWHLALPKMEIQKLIPSNLREENHSRQGHKSPLVIRNLMLEGFQGTLSNAKSFIGKGSLRFSNKMKSRTQNALFQIPSEILSRIGLDLSVLTPVTGAIDYRIQDGRIYLTKLKDVYSDRKLSRFYLSPNALSYMDFDGNLNVQVRMKQNNLLFKFAELFTVNIGGELSKPQYSFQRQSKEDVASQK